MGVLNFLKFLAACFDVLGWPVLALAYPLCASIQAIENDSLPDIRKLVTYWVLFSFMSLFDNAFVKLLQWIPLWPYIKLMVICWLVIPNFDGSYYVYQQLVHPCISVNPQTVMNWLFNELKQLFHRKENFLTVADQYIKENGAEALEKLLASKFKNEEHGVAQKEIQVVKSTEKKTLGAEKRVKGTETNLSQTESSTNCAAKMEEKVVPSVFVAMETGIWTEPSEIPLHNKVQKEWACAVCQVTTQSEATLNYHLQGKKHKAATEELNAKNQAPKIKVSPSASMAKKPDLSKEEQNKSTSEQLKAKTIGISAASAKKPDETKDQQPKYAPSSVLNQTDKNNETNEQCLQNNTNKTGDGMKQLGFWCNICNLNCLSEIDKASHLNGKKHLGRIKELSKLWCRTCDIRCSSQVDMDSHLKGARHLDQTKERSGLRCGICNVTCNSENNMNSHLNGKRHLDQIEERLKLWCRACNVSCTSEHDMASHLGGRRHLEKISK